MIRVLLVRHGNAVDAEHAPSDGERWLTHEGRRGVLAVARALDDAGLRATRVFTSPLVRAVQTGEILAGEGRFDGPIEVHSPLAGGTTTGALAVLDHVGDGDVVFLVGHEPLIRSMAARLIGFDRFPPFRTAGACLVSWSDGRGAFQWMLDPRSLTRIETVDDVT